jgi:hypothetical protein
LHAADKSTPYDKSLVGASVETSDGQMIGAVDDVIANSDGRSMVIVGIAGALGLGEKDVAVPLTDVTGTKPYPEGVARAASGTGFYAGSRGILVTIRPDLSALRNAPAFTGGEENAKSGQPSPNSGVPESVTKEPKSSTKSGGPG